MIYKIAPGSKKPCRSARLFLFFAWAWFVCGMSQKVYPNAYGE